MTYEKFPESARYAVRFHVGCPHAPDGWPAEANPLAEGEDPPDGYILRSGRELNTLRAKMHTAYLAVHEKIAKQHAREQAIREQDAETAAAIAEGFEWSGRRFSMSLAAQLNNLHDAPGPFPVTRSALDGSVITLDEKQFADFCAAMRLAIRRHRDAGHKAKAALQ